MTVTLHDVRKAVKNNFCFCTETRRVKTGVYGLSLERAIAKVAQVIEASTQKVSTLVYHLIRKGELVYVGNRLIALSSDKPKRRSMSRRHLNASRGVITQSTVETDDDYYEAVDRRYAEMMPDIDPREAEIRRWADVAEAYELEHGSRLAMTG